MIVACLFKVTASKMAIHTKSLVPSYCIDYRSIPIMMSPRLLAFEQGILEMCRSQFPKTCSVCGRHYPSFKSYIETITPIGIPKIDTIEDDDPIGLMSFGNCPCGNTLTLRCESSSPDLHNQFNAALQAEATCTGRPIQDILLELRDLIRADGIQEISH